MFEEAQTSGAHSPLTASDFSVASSSHSVMDMPVEGTKRAPKSFKGDALEVESFLRRFDRLALLHRLTPRERCETVTDYCGRVVRETIEGFAEYRTGDWQGLKERIKKVWNADLESKRFRVRDLEDFVSQSQQESIRELKDWRRYLRRFLRIAGWLQGRQKVTDNDYAYHMWMGLNPRFRQHLETRILLENPQHDMSELFGPEQITKAAEAILGVDRFDTERRVGLDSIGVHEDEDEPSTSQHRSRRQRDIRKNRTTNKKEQKPETDDDDTDEEDEDEEYTPSPRILARDRKGMGQGSKTPPKKERTEKQARDEQEFDKLVDQMQKLSLDNPKYGLLFLKACAMNPLAEHCLKKPRVNMAASETSRQPRFDQGQERQRDMPPHMGPRGPGQFSQQRLPPLPPTSGCFGCGESSHMMSECPKMQELLSKKVLLKNFRGQYTTADGTVLRRLPGENFIQAVSRMNPTVNLIRYGETLEQDTDTSAREASVLAYPVERGPRETRNYRQQPYKSTPSTSQNKGKQREAGPSQRRASPYPSQRITPVETQPRSFDPDNDTDMVVDPSSKHVPASNTVSKETAHQTEKGRGPARTSQVSKEINPDSILDKILDTPLTLSVREVVGVSKDVATRLTDVLKVKKVDFAQPAISNLVTKGRQDSLIHIELKHQDTPIDFIVDTGSELNIISDRVYNQLQNCLLDPSVNITMHDANGGSKPLQGLVTDIPLSIGGIKMPIDAYVAENPKFHGVLGRPWQREHQIGIEERPEGTYLTFPNEDGMSRSRMKVQEGYVNAGVASRGSPIGHGVFTILRGENGDPASSEASTPETVMDNESDDESMPDLVPTSPSDPESEDDWADADDQPSESERMNSSLDSDIDTSDTEEDRIERELLFNLRQMMQNDGNYQGTVSTGPCTILSDMSAEFVGCGLYPEAQTFLLRDAKVLTRDGEHRGHVLALVFPCTADSLRGMEQWRNEPEPDGLPSQILVQHQAVQAQPENQQIIGPIGVGMFQYMRFITVNAQVGGGNIQLIVDTGAQVDCISLATWQALQHVGQTLQSRTELISATGQPLICHGLWTVPLQLGGVKSVVKFYIIEGLRLSGILGRPWQKAHRMALMYTETGITIGIHSIDRKLTSYIRVDYPQEPIISREPQWIGQISVVDTIPEIRFEDTHQLLDLMDTTDSEDTEKPENLDLDTSAAVEDYDPWAIDPDTGELPNEAPPPSEVMVENNMYKSLLRLYCGQYMHPRSQYQPRIGRIEPFETDRLDLRVLWCTGTARDEELYLLRNVLVQVGDQYREGHGILQVAYFPHETERARMAKEENERSLNPSPPVELDESDFAQLLSTSDFWPKLTLNDLLQSMEEIGFELRDHSSPPTDIQVATTDLVSIPQLAQQLETGVHITEAANKPAT